MRPSSAVFERTGRGPASLPNLSNLFAEATIGATRSVQPAGTPRPEVKCPGTRHGRVFSAHAEVLGFPRSHVTCRIPPIWEPTRSLTTRNDMPLESKLRRRALRAEVACVGMVDRVGRPNLPTLPRTSERSGYYTIICSSTASPKPHRERTRGSSHRDASVGVLAVRLTAGNWILLTEVHRPYPAQHTYVERHAQPLAFGARPPDPAVRVQL